MAVKFRIKRRAAGGAAGAPSSLENAELAFNEQDNTLYYGTGTGGAGGSATSIIAIGGPGAFAPLASPTFTGTPAAPTAAADTSTTQLATTAYVVGQASSTNPVMDGTAAVGTSLKYARADHVHASDTSRAPLASPTFTGTPAAPTAAVNTSTTQLATTAFVLGQGNATAGTIAMNGTQAAGTSNLYARADHVHPTDTSRAPLASPTFTGTPAAPTAAADTSTTQLATTAYVVGQVATTTPLTDSGAGVVGTSLKYARGDHQHPLLRLDQLSAPTAAVSFNSQRITNVADPTSAQDAATRAYVDAATSGQKWLGARLASTATVSETGATATTLPVGGTTLTVDGQAAANGDIILLKDQTTSARNGAYTVSGVGTSVLLTRISAMDSASEIDGKVFIIEDGTQAGQVWITVSEVTTLGTDAIVFTRKSDASDIVDGNGLVFSGLTLNVGGTAGRISVGANAVDIDSAYVGQTSITTLGTVSTGTWSATAIAADKGGTGQTSYTTGDLLQASGASAISKLAAVATGNVLISGGVGTVSSWGKVGLTTHVSGTLAVGNGGTGATTLTGYVKGTGTAALTASSTIPNTDISGLGTMSTQNSSAVAITGGTIDGVTFDGGTF